jgi:hypothetical protein
MARAAKTPKTTGVADPVEVASKQRKMLPVVFVLTVLLCLAIASAGYFYYQYRNTAPVKDADEITTLTKTIGAFMELPGDETPTLATVTDKDKLADQPFFRKSENGDKVLIYTNTGRAILYRPSTKKIVDVTVVNVNQGATNNQQPTQTPVAETAPVAQTPEQTTPVAAPEAVRVAVALLNGSTRVGMTNTLENDIKAAFADIDVVSKEKASRNDYQGNLIVDLSGKYADRAKSIAESVSGTVGTLPAGETNPGTDILVIVGNKQAVNDLQ